MYVDVECMSGIKGGFQETRVDFRQTCRKPSIFECISGIPGVFPEIRVDFRFSEWISCSAGWISGFQSVFPGCPFDVSRKGTA